MDNFDLKQYLGDNRLVKEEQLNEGLLDFFKKLKPKKIQGRTQFSEPIGPTLDPQRFIKAELKQFYQKRGGIKDSISSNYGVINYGDRTGITPGIKTDDKEMQMMIDMYVHAEESLPLLRKELDEVNKIIKKLENHLAGLSTSS